MKRPENATVTVILPSGELPLPLMKKATEIAEQYNLGIYLSLAQNLRLIGVRNDDIEAVKAPLAELGATFKEKGRFAKPRICTGKRYCTLGQIDTNALSTKVFGRYQGRMPGAKVKMAISGCGNGCSNPRMTDIGCIATPKGIDIYLGGRTGRTPVVGRLAVKGADEEKVLEVTGRVIAFYEGLEGRKKRLCHYIEDDRLFASLTQ